MVKVLGAFVVGGLWALNIQWLSRDWWWLPLIASWFIAGWVVLKLANEPVDKESLNL